MSFYEDYDCGPDYPDEGPAPDYVCDECETVYSREEGECPECGNKEGTRADRMPVDCSHCGERCHGDAYCSRCGNRVHYDYDNLSRSPMEPFADPGGNSALRAASARNPRIFPCPDCGEPDRLTAADVALGYCCDACANRNEMGF